MLMAMLAVIFASCQKEASTQNIPEQELNLSVDFVNMDGNADHTLTVPVER